MIVTFDRESAAISRAAKRFAEKGLSMDLDMDRAFIQGQYVYAPFIEADEDGSWLATCHIATGEVGSTLQ